MHNNGLVEDPNFYSDMQSKIAKSKGGDTYSHINPSVSLIPFNTVDSTWLDTSCGLLRNI